MIRKIFILPVLLVFLMQCTTPTQKKDEGKAPSGQLPRVLIITTGISEQTTKLAPGIVVAIQSLNKRGAIVRLEPRDILYNSKELKSYNIILLSTFEDYHDADRKYSLSYMSDEEIHNLATFVSEGGVLIAGENVGRNYPDGTDRISVFQTLNPENWGLSECFCLSFSEKNVRGLSILGKIPGAFDWGTAANKITGDSAEGWTMIPDSLISNDYTLLASWTGRRDTAVAMIENQYNQGTAYYMGYSAYLQPENDGGYWSENQIDKFYGYVIQRYNQKHGLRISLSAWPSGYDYAFCVSFNAEGELPQYQRIFDFLREKKIEPLVFVNGLVNQKVKDYLIREKIPLASNGYSYNDYSDFNYPQAVDDILRNENYWNTEFHGFRFPYTKPSLWGLLALEELHYSFESSIGANNIDFFHGSVVPYNIVIAREGFYKSTGIYEIAPTYHDDYYFFNYIQDAASVDSMQLDKSVQIYDKYLENFWLHAVKPYKGLMVYLGHPQFVGYNDITLKALRDLVTRVSADNTWITSMPEVVDFRKKISQMQFTVSGTPQEQRISVKAPADVSLPAVCVRITGKIKSAKAAQGKVDIKENNNITSLIFSAFDKQEIVVTM